MFSWRKRLELLLDSSSPLQFQAQRPADILAARRSQRSFSAAGTHSRLGHRSARPGVTAVEFALVAPVFLLLVFGMIELGRMVMVQQSLTNAAREGCRTAALATTMDDSDVETAVRDFLQPSMPEVSDANKVRVTIPQSLSAKTSGTDLVVGVEVDYADVSWLPLNYLGLNPKIGATQNGKRE